VRLARLLAPAFAALAVVALSGCSSSNSTSPSRYDLTVNMSGMGPHVGQMLELRVVHAETGVEVGYAKIDRVTSTSFTVSVPDILVPGESYDVDWYADLNRNGAYDAPPVDHAWRRFIGPVQGPVTLTFMHDTNWTDIDFPAHP
jgi:hypothetical protein